MLTLKIFKVHENKANISCAETKEVHKWITDRDQYKKKGQPENTEKWTNHRKMLSIQIMKVLLVKDAFDQFNIKYH